MPTTNVECKLAAEAMVNAGYTEVSSEMVYQVFNRWNKKVFVAVIGDAMVVYTPEHKDEPIKIVVF